MDDKSLLTAILILGIGLAGTYYYKTNIEERSPEQKWQQWEQEQPKPAPEPKPEYKPHKPPEITPPPRNDDRWRDREPRFQPPRRRRWRSIYGCYIPGVY